MPNYYAVRIGKDGPKVYNSWNDCRNATRGFPGNNFKGFPSLQDANNYINPDKYMRDLNSLNFVTTIHFYRKVDKLMCSIFDINTSILVAAKPFPCSSSWAEVLKMINEIIQSSCRTIESCTFIVQRGYQIEGSFKLIRGDAKPTKPDLYEPLAACMQSLSRMEYQIIFSDELKGELKGRHEAIIM